MSNTYIVGYDASEASEAALRFVHTLARRTGAEVAAVTVYTRVPYVFARGAAAAADLALEEASREDAERMLAAIELLDVRTAAVAADSPAQGLHRQAEKDGAALLAVWGPRIVTGPDGSCPAASPSICSTARPARSSSCRPGLRP
jgi:nucleotide-binding universal stress UspA family protein